MVSFKCKDIGMDCKFEATAANVQDLDNTIAKHAREAHKIPSSSNRIERPSSLNSFGLR